MMNCRKCQKEYIPKREGGFFCSDSCGNSYRQQIKRDALKKARLVEQGKAVEDPLTETEQALWAVLTEVMNNGHELNTILRLPMEDVRREGIGGKLAMFVGDCKRIADRPMVQELEAKMRAQQEVETRIKGE